MNKVEIGVVSNTSLVSSLKAKGQDCVSFPLSKLQYVGAGVYRKEYSAWTGLSPLQASNSIANISNELQRLLVRSNEHNDMIVELQSESKKYRKRMVKLTNLSNLSKATNKKLMEEVILLRQFIAQQKSINGTLVDEINLLKDGTHILASVTV
jgi:hypothetical protein